MAIFKNISERRSQDGLSGHLQDEQGNSPSIPEFQPGNPAVTPFASYIFGGLVILLILVLYFSQVLGFSASQRFYTAGIVVFLFVANGIYIFVFPAIIYTKLKQSFEICDLLVTPSVLTIGDQTTCRFQFQAKRPVYLDSISATLSAVRVAVEDVDSETVTNIGVADEQTFTKSYAEKYAAGMVIYFECALPVLPDAPATYYSQNNKILWSVRIQIILDHSASWEMAIPVTVWTS